MRGVHAAAVHRRGRAADAGFGALAVLGTGVFFAATTLPADGIGRAGGRVVVGAAAAAGRLAGTAAARSTTGRVGVPHAASAAAPARIRHTRRNRTAGR